MPESSDPSSLQRKPALDRCPHCGHILSQEPAAAEKVEKTPATPAADPLLVALSVPTEYFSKTEARPQNERQHKRLSLKFKAAIRIGDEEDIVDVVDLSKGGMRFTSHKFYKVGMLVEFAVPYTAHNTNIFVAGKILRVHQRPTSFPGEYAMEIVR
jgi:hypothetical protein